MHVKDKLLVYEKAQAYKCGITILTHNRFCRKSEDWRNSIHDMTWEFQTFYYFTQTPRTFTSCNKILKWVYFCNMWCVAYRIQILYWSRSTKVNSKLSNFDHQIQLRFILINSLISLTWPLYNDLNFENIWESASSLAAPHTNPRLTNTKSLDSCTKINELN